MSLSSRMNAMMRSRTKRLVLIVGVLVVGGLLAGATVYVTRQAPQSDALPIVNTQASSIVESQVGDESSIVAVPHHPNGRLAVYIHGHGQTPGIILRDDRIARVSAELLRRGYVVAAASGGGNAWGNARSVSLYREFIDRLKARYGIHSVYYLGESMGGLATQQLAAGDTDARAVAEFFPVYNAATLESPALIRSLHAAYPGGGLDRVEPVAIASHLPLRVWASPQDTVVRAASNGQTLVEKAAAAGDDAQFIQTTGQHGDPSNFDPAAIAAFFAAH